METIKAAIRKIEIPRAARVQWLPRLDQILHTLNKIPRFPCLFVYIFVYILPETRSLPQLPVTSIHPAQSFC